MKNLYNALKYSTAFPLVYTGYLRKLEPSAWNDHAFVAAAILQSSYCFVWDVLMDWGLPKCADGLGEKQPRGRREASPRCRREAAERPPRGRREASPRCRRDAVERRC